MNFDYQPILRGKPLELRPLRGENYFDLYEVASDPLIWQQHPVHNRHEETVFKAFFEESLDAGGALVAKSGNGGNPLQKIHRSVGSTQFETSWKTVHS